VCSAGWGRWVLLLLVMAVVLLLRVAAVMV
jgi:hypothetical protein